MTKCTLCVDRLYDQSLPESERKPVCVMACPTSEPANHYLPRRKTKMHIHDDELVRADNPLKKEDKLKRSPTKTTTLDDSTSW